MSTAVPGVAWLRNRPPRAQPTTIERPRIAALLDDVISHSRLTVVTAPSGFGKTTAVSAWAARADRDVAWLSIGADDDENGYVDGNLVAAVASVLRRRDRTILTALADAEVDGLGDAQASLWAALESTHEAIVLVVDDAHRAERSVREGLLGMLIESGPETLRLVLVGTAQLEVRLTRQILGHPDCLIGAEALAFELDEIAALAAQTSSSADVETVLAETAGWPIAVRLGLLGAAGARTPGLAERGLMREYVRDAVLSALPKRIADFVMDAVVCDELTPRLAAELTEREDGGRLLEECRRLGLFLDRQDGPDGSVYRWHTLFARHCRELLSEQDPARLDALHRRAARLLSEPRPLDAIGHLLAVGDTDEAATIILDSWIALVTGSDAAGVERACVALRPPQSETPEILLVRACASDIGGDAVTARALFQRAEAAGDPADDRFVRTLELARLFVLDDRALVAEANGAVRARLARDAPLPAREQAAILFLVGWTDLRQRTHPARTIETLRAAVRKAGIIGDARLERRAQECLAYGLTWTGRMAEARAVLAGIEEVEDGDNPWRGYVGGAIGVAAGSVAFWAGDLETAELELRGAFAWERGSRTLAHLARVILAYVAAASGDLRLCRRAALELQFLPRTEVQGIAWPRFREISVALLEEAVGHRDRAVAIALGFADETSLPLTAVQAAGILRRSGDHARALQILRQHSAYSEISYVRVATLVAHAVQLSAQGRSGEAHELCEQALELAAAENLRILLSDDDPVLRELLGAHVAWGSRHEDFLMSCLRGAGVAHPLSVLSGRERDVFEQLRTTLTTTEIAERLGLSVNTVKTHQRAIYRKLGVGSRREALRRHT